MRSGLTDLSRQDRAVRNCTCPGVQNRKSAGIEAELCNEEGVMREGGDTDGAGDEAGDRRNL